ncbi:glycine-rich domain-containing protein [Streptomyces sp. NPDC093221]|uniref:glycine-rich domain-containing protein n=1 Tax=Streptomyces sp. NPDC093221 TaxID=3366032 RepID=UPI003800CDCB
MFLEFPAAAAAPVAPARDPRQFVSPAQWDKLVGLLMRDNPYDQVMAERVLGQAIAYLVTAMECRGQDLGLGPGHIIDIGVHTMILDTMAYADFCDHHNGGAFLHHVPEISVKGDGSVARTARRVAAHGFDVDWPLWAADAAKCTPCRPGEDGH